MPEGEIAHYVGRGSCKRCHPKEFQLWIGSDHDLAMDYATAETVLGNFNDQEFTHFELTSKMFRRGDEFFVTTENRAGQMETFQVKYTFGVRPLQQYLVEFPDGRVQCLPIAWDTERECWFHLYPDERIPPADPLHWTRPLQNWNYMCAECHTTNLQKNYNLADDTYHTTWSEIDVSCQTCHGPGSLHVELAESWGFFWDRRYGYGLPNLKDEDPRLEIETCAPCHSRRRIVYPNPRPGERFLDYYMPEILDGELYYADGQILEEDYVYGSFIQSRMYREKVRCSDCHDPHSARVKFNDNRLCNQCHVSATYDTPSHHHHPDSSKPGTLCVDCHMPETTYMVVDPRRDHSLRVPRPDLTVSLGIPNACNGCHDDQSKGETPEWAEQQVQQWYGDREGPRHFAHAIHAGRKGLAEAEKELAAVVRRKDTSAMVRASAISLLGRHQSPVAQAAAMRGLEDPEELVRAVSVRSLQYLSTEELHRRLARLLHDPVRAVRTEAARVMARVPRRVFSRDDRQAFDLALAEYMEGQEAVNDQAAAHLNMAVIYTDLAAEELAQATHTYQQAMVRADLAYRTACDLADLAYERAIQDDPASKKKADGQRQSQIQKAQKQRDSQERAAHQQYQSRVRKATQKAEQSYLQALRLDPQFVPARINLAMLHDQRGEKDKAEKLFREVIELEPELAEAYYSLGLLLAENEDRLEEAAEFLTTAARLAPDNSRIHYNRGLALQKLGRPQQAEQALKTAYELSPGTLDYLKALTILYAQQGQWKRAIACAEEMVRTHPGDRGLEQLLNQVRQEWNRGAESEQDKPATSAEPGE